MILFELADNLEMTQLQTAETKKFTAIEEECQVYMNSSDTEFAVHDFKKKTV